MKHRTVSVEEETDHHIDVREVREQADESKLFPDAVNRLIVAEKLVGGQADGCVGQWQRHRDNLSSEWARRMHRYDPRAG